MGTSESRGTCTAYSQCGGQNWSGCTHHRLIGWASFFPLPLSLSLSFAVSLSLSLLYVIQISSVRSLLASQASNASPSLCHTAGRTVQLLRCTSHSSEGMCLLS